MAIRSQNKEFLAHLNTFCERNNKIGVNIVKLVHEAKQHLDEWKNEIFEMDNDELGETLNTIRVLDSYSLRMTGNDDILIVNENHDID